MMGQRTPQPTIQNKRRSRLLILLATCVSCALLAVYAWQHSVFGPRPEREDLPLIAEEVKRLGGVSIVEVTDVSPPDEAEVYLTLAIEGKGPITLYNATLESFTGGGRLHIISIGDCRQPRYHADSYDYPELRVTTVKELIDKYDLIYARLLQEGRCASAK